jgi:predicted DNA-binding protein (MmcQ/YjbR family)
VIKEDPKVVARVKKICLALPEASLVTHEHVPHLGFRVADRKNFAYYTMDHHGDGRICLSVRAEKGENAELVASDPERFGLPKYMAQHGWVEYFLDLLSRPPDWDEVAELVADSYRLQAPKRLLKLLG